MPVRSETAVPQVLIADDQPLFRSGLARLLDEDPRVEIIGQAGYLTRGSPAAVVAGRLEMYARSMIILTFGGGTNEIQRDLIAIFGLGMPRSLR